MAVIAVLYIITSAIFDNVELVLALRPSPRLLTVKVSVLALASRERPLVYPAEAQAACRIVLVIAGTLAERLLDPL